MSAATFEDATPQDAALREYWRRMNAILAAVPPRLAAAGLHLRFRSGDPRADRLRAIIAAPAPAWELRRHEPSAADKAQWELNAAAAAPLCAEIGKILEAEENHANVQ